MQKEKEEGEKNKWMKSYYNPIPTAFLSPSAFKPDFDYITSNTRTQRSANESLTRSRLHGSRSDSNILRDSENQSTYRSGKYSVIDEPVKTGELPFKKRLINVMFKIRRLKIDSRDFTNRKIFNDRPYSNDFSRDFLQAAKEENKLLMEHYLKMNKYLVYDFDKVKFHWLF